jgi:hypothetical protein
MINGRPDHAGSGLHLGLRPAVRLEHVFPFARNRHAKAVGGAVFLPSIDEPAAVGRAVGVDDRRWIAAIERRGRFSRTVSKPCGVGDLVEAVDVLCLAARRDPQRLRRRVKKDAIDRHPDFGNCRRPRRANDAARVAPARVRTAGDADRFEIGVFPKWIAEGETHLGSGATSDPRGHDDSPLQVHWNAKRMLNR